jgi:ribosomal protein S13
LEKNFLFDKLIPFIKKGNKLNILNLYQVYIQRYGIGKTISYRISMYSGVNSSVKLSIYKENDINTNTKLIFFFSENSLDSLLEKSMKISLKKSVDMYDYRGSKYVAKLPINGQRRRANRKTAKKIRPIPIA